MAVLTFPDHFRCHFRPRQIKTLSESLLIIKMEPVILFGHFKGLTWESFPIQKWPLFFHFQEF